MIVLFNYVALILIYLSLRNFYIRKLMLNQLEPVNFCFNVEKKVASFVNRNQKTCPHPMFHSNLIKPPKKYRLTLKPYYKKCLSDWRTLYDDTERPRTQSSISRFAIHQHLKAEVLDDEPKSFRRKIKSSMDRKHQTT